MARPVLLTGASGLLGTWLRRTAPPTTDVVALTHRTAIDDQDTVTADLRDAAQVAAAVVAVSPAVVLHAAYDKHEAAIVDATANVVAAATAVGAAVVHISTDAVFAGDGGRRDEDDRPDPVFDYGRWKARAEQLVRDAPGAAVVRLPLVVSLDPADHVVARVRAGAETGEATTWFTDELRQPAWAAELAGALWQIVGLDQVERVGTWHLPGPETLSRYQLAERVVTRLGLPAGTIDAGRCPPGRPAHLDLGADRAVRVLGWAPHPVLA